MNGIEKILDRIAEDAQAEADRVLSEAQREADSIASRYAQQAERLTTAAQHKAKEAAAERQDRLHSAAQMEAKKQLLTEKQAILDRAFLQAAQSLRALPPQAYTELLAKFAAHVSRSGQEAITLSAQDRAAFGQAIVDAANTQLKHEGRTGMLTLSENTAEISGGLLLGDGTIEVNCSFDTLLRLCREEIAVEVAAILFS